MSAVRPLPELPVLGDAVASQTGPCLHDADQRLHRPDPSDRAAGLLDRGDLPVIRQYRDQAARLHDVSGHFEFVEIGGAKLVRFDSSPQCYTRDARLVSRAGSDEFMFDFQRRGQSAMVQAGNEGTIDPGYGVLYDARRPFEDRLFGPEQRAEVLIATVPAASLLRSVPEAERLCAKPVPLSGTVARSIAALVRDAISMPDAPAKQDEPDIVAYLSALLRLAAGASHQLSPPGPVRPDRHLSEDKYRQCPVGAGACRRIRHLRADVSSHLCRPRDHVRTACPSSACRTVPKSAAAGFAGRRSDRETCASVRLCRCRPCDAHVQEQIWRHAAGLSRRRPAGRRAFSSESLPRT